MRAPFTEKMGAAAERAPVPLSNFDTEGLPANFIRRLERDSMGSDEYSRVDNIAKAISARPANSSHCGHSCSGCLCKSSVLIRDGQLGRIRDRNSYEFLAPGYHSYFSCGLSIDEPVSLTVLDSPVVNGNIGFITIREAKVGVIIVGSNYKLLAPGSYQWNSPRVSFVGVVNLTQQRIELGPYTLFTVPVGSVAVTFNNGDLVILGYDGAPGAVNAAPAVVEAEASSAKRTYFLENAKWRLEGFLPIVMQTDRLEGNDLLSKDNVEVLMVAMSNWRIVDPVRAVTHCATTMEDIRKKVNQLVRATIARIVASTNIGAGPVSGHATRPVVTAQPVNAHDAHHDGAAKPKDPQQDEADLAYMMKSEMATRHMAELTAVMDYMGIEVVGVYVPEKQMKNDDIRQEVAKQAVIGIKADAERAAADARAYATVKAAKAEAEAIELLAKAHSEAGLRLGNPESTSARLALSAALSDVLKDANLTVFSGAPEQMPFILTGPSATAGRR